MVAIVRPKPPPPPRAPLGVRRAGNPTTSCGEENLLMLEGDRYRCENILVSGARLALLCAGRKPSARPVRPPLRAWEAEQRLPQLHPVELSLGGVHSRVPAAAAWRHDAMIAPGSAQLLVQFGAMHPPRRTTLLAAPLSTSPPSLSLAHRCTSLGML